MIRDFKKIMLVGILIVFTIVISSVALAKECDVDTRGAEKKWTNGFLAQDACQGNPCTNSANLGNSCCMQSYIGGGLDVSSCSSPANSCSLNKNAFDSKWKGGLNQCKSFPPQCNTPHTNCITGCRGDATCKQACETILKSCCESKATQCRGMLNTVMKGAIAGENLARSLSAKIGNEFAKQARKDPEVAKDVPEEESTSLQVSSNNLRDLIVENGISPDIPFSERISPSNTLGAKQAANRILLRIA